MGIWKTIITDVDGVLTDGSFMYSEEGKYAKRFGPHDADAVKFFNKLGVNIIAISADKRGFGITSKRLQDMNVKLLLISESERLDWITKNFSSNEIAFIGDGYHDIGALKYASVGFTPENALEIVKNNADIVLATSGGNGVLFEVFSYFLKTYYPDKYIRFSEGIFDE